MDNHYMRGADGSRSVREDIKRTPAGRVAEANVLHLNRELREPGYDPQTAYLNDGTGPRWAGHMSPVERLIRDVVTNGVGYAGDYAKAGGVQESLRSLDSRTGDIDLVEEWADVVRDVRRYADEGVPGMDAIAASLPDEAYIALDVSETRRQIARIEERQKRG